MFWIFLLKLFVADWICVLVFAIGLMVVLAPFALVARKESAVAIVGIPMLVVAIAFQAYFWGLWAAFCSATAVKHSAMPEVSHHWLYYVIGFGFCVAPLGWLASKERMMSQTTEDARAVERGASQYSLIAIVAFIVFSVWPSLSEWPYSWILQFVV
jgi:hypothetical protein